MRAFIPALFSGSAIFYYIYKKDNHMTVWLSFNVSL